MSQSAFNPPTDRPAFPDRYVNRDMARLLYGERADSYASLYWQMDPLADAVAAEYPQYQAGTANQWMLQALNEGIETVPDAPQSFRDLFAEIDTVPTWVDPRRMALGAKTYQRLGPSAGFILSAWSLMNGYHNGAAVKPLAFTKQLDSMAPRRLNETGRFVFEVIQTNGMQRFAEGFKVAVRVRLMHAQVRRMLLRSGAWNWAAWGAPIPQPDMSGTIVEFSGLMLDGARQMGHRISREEGDALIHLWRYVGYVSGVRSDLLFDTESAMREFGELTYTLQSGPDEDSIALAQALRRVPYTGATTQVEKALAPLMSRVHDGLTWAFNGDRIATALQIPNPGWRNVMHPIRLAVGALETARTALPGGTDLFAAWGNQLFRETITARLAKKEPSFLPVKDLASSMVQKYQTLRSGGQAHTSAA